jgi:hypothetical protein
VTPTLQSALPERDVLHAGNPLGHSGDCSQIVGLIPYKTGGKDCTAIVGKVKKA